MNKEQSSKAQQGIFSKTKVFACTAILGIWHCKSLPIASQFYVTEVKKTKECKSGLITCSSLQARMTNCYAHILGVLRYLINPEADDVPGAVREANLSPADRAAARSTLLQVWPWVPECSSAM